MSHLSESKKLDIPIHDVKEEGEAETNSRVVDPLGSPRLEMLNGRQNGERPKG